ncbi:hypothetical protein GXP76_01710 [Streptomyces sp. NP-1717]|nr:hypothetical protein [Streptomyces sp. NP-1717]
MDPGRAHGSDPAIGDTVWNYEIGMGKTAERLGEARSLASVADGEVGEVGAALELLWGPAAVNTRNSRRTGVLSWLGRCRERGHEGPMVPGWAERRRCRTPRPRHPQRWRTTD